MGGPIRLPPDLYNLPEVRYLEGISFFFVLFLERAYSKHSEVQSIT